MTEAVRPQAGSVIGGKYKVLRLLGEGGMGCVYEAENSWTHRRVAVKVLLPEYAANAEAARRFLREAQAAAQLSHPNIVDVLDMGREGDDGALFIVQELLDGTDLRHRLVEAGRLSPREAVEVLAPVMEALAFAHERGVIHRDLKPENIFLARTPTGVVPTLIDFGISKVAAGAGEQFRTKTGMILGTPWYMSPEQALGQPLDGRADLWAMGVVLYELLAGHCPFEVATPSVALVHIVTRPTPRIEELAPDIPPALAEVVHRALERDLPKRFPDMAAFVAALRACPLPDAPLVGRPEASGTAPTVGPPVPAADAAPAVLEPAVDPLGRTDPPPALRVPTQPVPGAPPAAAVALADAAATPVAAPIQRQPTLPAATPPVALVPPAPTVLMAAPPAVFVAPPYAATDTPAEQAPARGRWTLALIVLSGVVMTACLASGIFVAWTHRGPEQSNPDAVGPGAAPTGRLFPTGSAAPSPATPTSAPSPTVGTSPVRSPLSRGRAGRTREWERDRERERERERERDHERERQREREREGERRH